MSIQIVRAALESRLKAWADAQSPSIPVSFQNVSFVKPNDGVWLEAFLIPNDTFNRQVDGQGKTLHGFFHINCWTRTGSGMGQAEGVAEALVSLYPLFPKFGPVSIESTPSVDRPMLDESGWVVTPVLISYRFEA
jgi:hypothetical protein